ncbi:centromere protein O [Sorex fumeus]|uniref:centromere protein O n=1 Tax=Sorex fumeus TaxID=62283 RepID=UPI0024ADBBF2|nr:centromere protein O [Sorex fumeus]
MFFEQEEARGQTVRGDSEARGQGVLAPLERLETQMNRSQKRLKERAEEKDLKARIHKLRLVRDQLRAEVKRRESTVQASGAGVEPGPPLAVSTQETLERKEETVKALLQAYRFTGLSAKMTSRGVCVCISTTFEGNLLESYFVDIEIQKPLRIHHHSVPPFIPLEQLSAKYLQTDIQHFLFRLHEYLNAYSGRKYQADRLQSDFAAFLVGPPQRNALCNLLTFTYKVEPKSPSSPFCARLVYKDLAESLPTAVTVTAQGKRRPGDGAACALGPSWEEQQAAHEDLFRTKPLHHVFAAFSKEGEKMYAILAS